MNYIMMCNLKIDWIKINFAEFLQNLESSRISNCENKIIYSRRFRTSYHHCRVVRGWLWNWCESSAVVKWAEKKIQREGEINFFHSSRPNKSWRRRFLLNFHFIFPSNFQTRLVFTILNSMKAMRPSWNLLISFHWTIKIILIKRR